MTTLPAFRISYHGLFPWSQNVATSISWLHEDSENIIENVVPVINISFGRFYRSGRLVPRLLAQSEFALNNDKN